jgi:Phage integrase family
LFPVVSIVPSFFHGGDMAYRVALPKNKEHFALKAESPRSLSLPKITGNTGNSGNKSSVVDPTDGRIIAVEICSNILEAHIWLAFDDSLHGRAGAYILEAQAKNKEGGLSMAAVYKVGKKWRADWTDNEGIRHRQRFKTKGEADEYLTSIKGQLKEGTYVAPKDVPTLGALADSWIAGRIAQSKTPGSGYRPLTLAQWQTHIVHMKACLGEAKQVNDIDASAIERAIGKMRLPKEQGGRGLSVKTVGKVLTTMSRIFKFGIRNKCGIQTDPVKLIEKVKENSGEQTETGERLNILHEVTEKEVLTPEEAKRVILAAEPGLYRTIIQTAIYTGARISELLALRWQDVKLDRSVADSAQAANNGSVSLLGSR